jgi:hypothetical protein
LINDLPVLLPTEHASWLVNKILKLRMSE